MAKTYDVHKTKVDTSMPTPEVLFHPTPNARRFLRTDVGMSAPRFNGISYTFVTHIDRQDTAETWTIYHVVNEVRSPMASGSSWPVCYQRFLLKWEALCELERDQEAVRFYAADVMDEPERAQDARLAGLRLDVGAWTLAPAFEEQTYEYDATASTGRLDIYTTKKFPGQAISVSNGEASQPDALSVTVPGGAGVLTLTITVTAEDGVTTATYTFSIHR